MRRSLALLVAAALTALPTALPGLADPEQTAADWYPTDKALSAAIGDDSRMTPTLS